MLKRNVLRVLFLGYVLNISPALCVEAYSEKIRQPLQDFYDKCLQAGTLKPSGSGHKIDFAQIEQSVSDGYATLQLIESLEKQQDEASKTLLAAINELCYRRFVSLLSSFNQSEHALVIEKLHYLAHKEVLIDGVCTTPFKTALSKMLLTVAIVNAQKIKPTEKKELLAQVLSVVEANMLKINQGLGADSVQENEIRELVVVLEVAAIKIPVATINYVKVATLVALIVLVVVVIYYRNELKLYTGVKLQELKRYTELQLQALANFIRMNFLRPLINGAAADVQAQIDPLIAESSRSIGQRVPVLREQVQGQLGQLISGVGQGVQQQVPPLAASVQAQIGSLITEASRSVGQQVPVLREQVQGQLGQLISGASQGVQQQVPPLAASVQAQIDPLINNLCVSIAQRLSFLTRSAIFVNGGLLPAPPQPAQPQAQQPPVRAVVHHDEVPDFGQ
jgi:hypothetical protein